MTEDLAACLDGPDPRDAGRAWCGDAPGGGRAAAGNAGPGDPTGARPRDAGPVGTGRVPAGAAAGSALPRARGDGTGAHAVRGATGHRAGLAAEDIVRRAYEERGLRIAAERWRTPAGEIDLIARDGDAVIFVEVKKARDHAAAAARIGPRQMARIARSAEIFLGGEPRGTDTPCRIDVALVDAAGRVDLLENVMAA